MKTIEPLAVKLMIFFLFLLCLVCVPVSHLCVCVLNLCVRACVCPCLFRLAVPTVLAGKRRPPPRAHPGGVCLGRPGGGHHQQNIPDLQRSAGTATRRRALVSAVRRREEQSESDCDEAPGRAACFAACCSQFAL